MRILTFSTLYPNSAQPTHGLFVEHRLRRLAALPDIDIKVVAPVPWFPSRSARFAPYSSFANAPSQESRFGLSIAHPRYIVIPKIGMTVAPVLLALGAYRYLAKAVRDGEEIDLIDAHYFYPDGVAAAILARQLDKPFIVTARGTDINLLPKYTLPRAMIKWAGRRASHIVTVCQALKDSIVALGFDSAKISVLRNGVDLNMFQPVDKAVARDKLSLTNRTLLSVGHLVERKGHHIVIDAMTKLPEFNLVIIGDGPMREKLQNQIDRLHLGARVQMVGAVSQEHLPLWYSGADALVLASSREGMANVLLESIACGTPVIATNVWGNPEVITDPVAGLLIDRTPAGIAAGVRALFDNVPDQDAVRSYAENYSWDETIAGLASVAHAAIDASRQK